MCSRSFGCENIRVQTECDVAQRPSIKEYLLVRVHDGLSFIDHIRTKCAFSYKIN